MWSKLCQRLSDPLFYRKRGLQLLRVVRPPRAARPVTLDRLLEKPGPALVVIAHPDDELFASGLLCEFAARGREFHLACLTRGEGGITGAADPDRPRDGWSSDRPAADSSRSEDQRSREALGRRREAELRASAAALGAASVEFLGHLDPRGKSHRTFAPDVSATCLAAQLAGLLEKFRPSLLVTHGSGGEYWHPAHLLAHRAVFQAAGNSRDILTIHAWQASHALPGLLNRDDPADLLIDGTRHRAARLAAFRAHRSQYDYFANHGGGSLEAFVELSAREGYRHYPASGAA